MIAIGGWDGFVKGTEKIFIAGVQNESDPNYHSDVTHELYQKWLQEVLPVLPLRSVVVLDNASYHNSRVCYFEDVFPIQIFQRFSTNFQKSDVPRRNTKKADMIAWLEGKGVEVNKFDKKDDIWIKVQEVIKVHPQFAIDDLAASYGVKFLRLPPYHPGDKNIIILLVMMIFAF